LIARNAIFLIVLLLLLSVISIVYSLVSGSIEIPLYRVFGAMTENGATLESQILLELRLPRSLAAFTTGGLLALSGVIMQVLLRNPLADPYILGISGGAAVAALGTILAGVSSIWIPQAAFLGALLSILVVFGIASAGGYWSVSRLLLTGVVVSAGWGAVINVLLTSSSSNNVQSMLFWLMGDLSQSRVSFWHSLVLICGLSVCLGLSRTLNVLIKGELSAQSLGVNIKAIRIVLYFTASVLTASAVTIAGSVGFVGLIIPHLLRLLGARDHRMLLPGAALLGGCFLVTADTLARTLLAPQQLPVGVVTAMIGVPLFLIILRSTVIQSK
jgi:iron complex transport system permease protein